MTIRGFVEAIAEHEVRGWAFDDDHPGRHLPVVARLDGTALGESLADILRPDLLAEGIGDGDHEFRIGFAYPIRPADLARLQVEAGTVGAAYPLELLPGSNHSRADAASDPETPISDPNQHPVFILGPARSGTSALALALLKSGRYEGHGEGHLMPLAKALLDTVDNYYETRLPLTRNDTTLRSIHLASFQRMIRRGFVQLTRAAFPSGYWIDKTPTAEMVRAAPLMREIWPNARFIFMKRRVLEVIASRRRKFPQDTLENHYLDWADVMQAWLDVRHQLEGVSMEVEQLALVKPSENLIKDISNFVDLPNNRVPSFDKALRSDHPEQTSTDPSRLLTLKDLDLTQEEASELSLNCDRIMRQYGYS